MMRRRVPGERRAYPEVELGPGVHGVRHELVDLAESGHGSLYRGPGDLAELGSQHSDPPVLLPVEEGGGQTGEVGQEARSGDTCRQRRPPCRYSLPPCHSPSR